MDGSGLVLGCLLLAQIASTSPTAGWEAPGTSPRIVQEGQPRARGLFAPGAGGRAAPPEMIAEALKLPPGASLIGRPLALVEALTSARGRSQQLEVIRAYWRVTMAVGEYRLRMDESEHLRRLTSPRAEDATVLRTARASAAAAERSAEREAVRGQHELAEVAGLSTALPLPLPADLPLVGSYLTGFENVYASRNLPPRVRLIDRVLPVRLEAIEKRTAAVQAAGDALDAVAEAYASGQADLWSFLACLADCGRQRQALLAEVCQYNQDIAEYALTVLGASVSARDLVAKLIKPTNAAPRGPAPEPGRQEPTPAPPRRPGTQGYPSAAAPLAPQARPDATDSLPPGAAQRTANRLMMEGPAGSGFSGALYSALSMATPAVRTKELCQALHAERTPPPQPGEAIGLRDCLARIPASLRRSVLDAFWLARQRAAECQALVAEENQLAELAPVAMERGSRPGGAVEGLRLRAARLAAEADSRQSQARLLEARFELTRSVGRPLDREWLLPTTPPHAGYYLLKLEAQPPQVTESRAVQRLATVIPALSETLQERATAVVEADSARAAATATYQGGNRPIDPLLPCTRQQTMETLGFLETLTAYNRAIAEYVLTVVPSSISADQLVQTLVVSN